MKDGIVENINRQFELFTSVDLNFDLNQKMTEVVS